MDKQSSRTRTESFIKKAKSLTTPIVRNTLIFRNALIGDMRKIRQCEQKKRLNLVRLDILRKSRFQNMLQNTKKLSRKIINQQPKKSKNIREKSKQITRYNVGPHYQYKTIKSLKDNLPEDHCTMHFDYSENWSCKYSRKITSVHFGASQQQATLHDGLIH